MEIYYDLINKIAGLSEEEVEKLEESYNNLFEGMTNNQELINETRRAMKAAGMTTTDIEYDKEAIYTLVNHMSVSENFSEKKKELLKKVADVTMAIYDKAIETGMRETVIIPVELCKENAKLPTYAHEGDAGFDIYLPEDFIIKAHEYGKIAPTGLKMAIPSGYELQIRPRSGNSVKTTLRIANAPGTIDNGYCNEIGVICDNIGDTDLEFKKGDRIAQGIVAAVPKGIFNQVEDIMKVTGANRGGGYGSTGN